MLKFVAVLSSTVLTKDGIYQYEGTDTPPDVSGLPHYVGHPATRYLLDGMGAVYTPGYFGGLKTPTGDRAFYAGHPHLHDDKDDMEFEGFYVAQLKDPRKGSAFTVDQSNVTADDLKWGVVIRRY
jgi:hypothetical protein